MNRLNAKPSNTFQRIQKFFDLMENGIYDDWQLHYDHKHNINGHNKTNTACLFVQVAVFVWPLVCSSKIAIRLNREKGLHTFFKGTSASTFRAIVEHLGFNEDTYPYFPTFDSPDTENKVLRIWEGTDFSDPVV